MPTALLVHAHSESDSFVTAMRDRIAQTLAGQGYAITHSDLYAMNFNPVLSPADFGQRSTPDHLVYALEQRHNFESGTLAADIVTEIEKIRAADLVVLTFPLFWFSVPAILKGWFDRVFISGTFYGGKTIYGRGGMAGTKACAAFSLGGREDMFGERGIHGPLVHGMMRHLFQGTLGYIGADVIEPFVAHNVPYQPLEVRSRCLDELAEYFSDLDNHPRIPIPDLDKFGPRFEPL